MLDVPAKDSRALKAQLQSDPPPTVVSARFELSANEVAALEAKFGAGFVTKRVVTVSKGYSKTRYYNSTLDEKTAVQHLLQSVQLPDDAKIRAADVSDTPELKAFLEGIPEPHSSVITLLAEVTAWRGGRLSSYVIDTFLDPWLPKFFYFDEYSVMPGRVALDQLQQRKAANQLSEGEEKAFDAFLHVGGADPADLKAGTRTEALIRELENAGIGITAEAMQFWSQNEGLRVLVRESQADPNDEDANLRSGQILNLRIENLRSARGVIPFRRALAWFCLVLLLHRVFLKCRSGTPRGGGDPAP